MAHFATIDEAGIAGGTYAGDGVLPDEPGALRGVVFEKDQQGRAQKIPLHPSPFRDEHLSGTPIKGCRAVSPLTQLLGCGKVLRIRRGQGSYP